MAEEQLIWRVPFAKHVVLTYDPRDLKKPVTQERKWSVKCEKCDATFQGVCNTGRIREHATKFTLSHYHKDPFK